MFHLKKKKEVFRQRLNRCLAITDQVIDNFIWLCLTVKVGIGGFSMGAAMALYSATCYALGRYGNGNPYPVNLRAIIGLSGWLPGGRYNFVWNILSQTKPDIHSL